MKKHMDKYHTVKNMNIEELVILPEVTEQRKNNLHEIVIEHGRIANVEELLQEKNMTLKMAATSRRMVKVQQVGILFFYSRVV